jgi:hypothetical protein
MIKDNVDWKNLPRLDIKDIEAGDLVFRSGTSFIARAIQKFQDWRFNHVAIALDIWGVTYVAESEKPGFITNSIADSIKGAKDVVIGKPKGPMKRSKEIVGKVITPMLGKHRYDFASLLFFQAIYTITSRFSKSGEGIWLGKKDNKAMKRLYCSEAAAYIWYVLSGGQIFKKWWKYNPKMLMHSMYFDFYRLKPVKGASNVPERIEVVDTPIETIDLVFEDKG